MFFDYHAHSDIDADGVAGAAAKLGWGGVCMAGDAGKGSKIPHIRGMEIVQGCKIETRKPGDVKKIARKNRGKFDIILVHGGIPEINRAACETPEVDILCHPEADEGQGLDMTMAKMAAKNRVAIEFNFHSLMVCWKLSRARLIGKMMKNAAMVRKAGAPFVLATGALEKWDVRSPSEMMSFGCILGFEKGDARKALLDNLLRKNQEKISDIRKRK